MLTVQDEYTIRCYFESGHIYVTYFSSHHASFVFFRTVFYVYKYTTKTSDVLFSFFLLGVFFSHTF